MYVLRNLIRLLVVLFGLTALLSIEPVLLYASVPDGTPSQWKGINYFPRRHQFYNMLNDWYSWDPNAGQYVYQSVNQDLATLSQNGFNFVHLYLWDAAWFGTGFNPMCGVLTGGKEITDVHKDDSPLWRQTRNPASGWQNPNFDDHSWQAAIDEGANGTGPWGPVGLPQDSLARWIWEYDSRSGNDTDTVYFRRTFFTNQASQTLYITADNSFTVYVNGVQVGSGSNWQTVYSFPVTLNTGPTSNVIAVAVNNAGGPGGFIADLRGSKDPTASPNNQWAALDDYLSRAEANGLYVGLHFVSLCPVELLGNGVGNDSVAAKQMGNQFADWANTFVNHFSANHGNVLMWGMPFALGPLADPGSTWNDFFFTAFAKVSPAVHAPSPATARPGLIAVNLSWPYLGLAKHDPPQQEDGTYTWDWKYPQQAAKTMHDQVGSPDIYMIQTYNANSANIARDLGRLTGPPTSGGMTIPPGALLAVEFATSSSVPAPPYGNGVPSSGDADTPTSDLNGQAQWLSNSLCAFDSVGMTKLAYFGLYDASDFWAAAPFNIDPASDLMGWNGYWGLLPLQGAAKPAWTTLTNYYRSGVQSLGCSLPAPPVLTLTADKQSVAAGQPLKLTWTAADTTSMSLSGVGPVVGSYDSKTIFPSGSGPVTYTLTANNGSVQRSVSVSVNVTGGQSFSTLTVSINGAGNIISSPAGINCPSACSGSFPTGSTVTLSAIPASNYVFSGWSGGGCSGTGSCTLALNQATNVSATFTQSLQTLAVSFAGSGAGVVTSSPAGISCSSNCSAAFSSGTQVSLTATPSSGSVFAGWSGGGCSGTGSCTIVMSSSQSVAATFNVAAPVINSVTDSNYSTNLLTTTGTIIVWGANFTVSGNNTLQFHSYNGYADVWMSQGDGHYYWDYASGQINAGLDGRLAAGWWMLTVRNAAGVPSAGFNVYINAPAPTISSVTDSNYSTNLQTTTGTIIVWGSNFSPSGNNTLQFHSSNGYADVWMYQGDGHYYWDYASGQINASLDGRLAAGWWMLTVRNASGVASAGFNVYINTPVPAPAITAITDSAYSSTLYQWSTIIVWGANFSPGGFNTIQFQSSNGYPDVWAYQGDGHYYWDYATGQINASLDYRLQSGWWLVTVRNANGVQSPAYWIYIN